MFRSQPSAAKGVSIRSVEIVRLISRANSTAMAHIRQKGPDVATGAFAELMIGCLLAGVDELNAVALIAELARRIESPPTAILALILVSWWTDMRLLQLESADVYMNA